MAMSMAYERVFEGMLAEAATAAGELDVRLVPFWPVCGAAYDRELLVIGRSVNGWVADWSAGELRDPERRRVAVASVRKDAEPADGNRMAWVSDLWGAPSGYNTKRSAFWRAIRRISSGDDAPPEWPSRLVWTNLYKVSPAAGWNPGGDLQRAQRRLAIQLLRMELAELSPRRVLALTGGWIRPFVDNMALQLETRPGLVESVGQDSGRAWVVAKHPMGKPGDLFVREVRKAFADLGAAIANSP
jgi:hypothetical protein